MAYHDNNNIKEPLILEPEDWTSDEWQTLKKVFGCPEHTVRIKVTYNRVEHYEMDYVE